MTLLELLKKLEWNGDDGIPWCLICLATPEEGHVQDCQLKAWIERLERVVTADPDTYEGAAVLAQFESLEALLVPSDWLGRPIKT